MQPSLRCSQPSRLRTIAPLSEAGRIIVFHDVVVIYPVLFTSGSPYLSLFPGSPHLCNKCTKYYLASFAHTWLCSKPQEAEEFSYTY